MASPRIALIAGSGLAGILERVEGQSRPWVPQSFPLRWRTPSEDPESTPDREVRVVEGALAGVPILGFGRRLHYYEGCSMAEITELVREAHRWGARTLFLTNASGSLRRRLRPGDLVAVRDHLNLMHENPFRGDPQFVDLSRAYDRALLRLARWAATEAGLDLKEGVYAAVPGPSFETPAEVRMLRALGADVVGMSTVPEVIVAASLGMRVLALSVVANPAGAPGAPAKVIETARAATGRMAEVLEGVARRLS